jgi:protein gp37
MDPNPADFGGVFVCPQSGPKARRMRESRVLEIKAACERSRVPFFFKQWGGVRKDRSGRTLDGRTYDQLPTSG